MEQRILLNASELADALRRAHHEFELTRTSAGESNPDPDWPAWYAQFIVRTSVVLPSVQPGRMGFDSPFSEEFPR